MTEAEKCFQLRSNRGGQNGENFKNGKKWHKKGAYFVLHHFMKIWLITSISTGIALMQVTVALIFKVQCNIRHYYDGLISCTALVHFECLFQICLLIYIYNNHFFKWHFKKKKMLILKPMDKNFERKKNPHHRGLTKI